MDELYKETILELNRNPLNKKVLADFDKEARELNPICGDDITVRLKFDESGTLIDIGYQGNGCAISQATASMITEKIKGMQRESIRNMGKADVIQLLGAEILPTRLPCALLCLKAIQKSV